MFLTIQSSIWGTNIHSEHIRLDYIEQVIDVNVNLVVDGKSPITVHNKCTNYQVVLAVM